MDQSRMARPPAALDFQLADILEFRPDQGIIRLRDQRVFILSAAAMGLLRKELVDTLGVATARRLLLRFGYADGYHDALNLGDQFGRGDAIQALRLGALLHTLEGIVHSVPERLDYDPATGRFEGRFAWHRSYEAEQHIFHYGAGVEPVCWSLVGYMSGYASACLGQDVYFREEECLGQGAARCSLIGRHAAGWRDELEQFRFDYQGADLRGELERLRVAARRQRQELARREEALARREREMDVLRARVMRHAEAQRFIARSAAMRDVLELAARVAPLDTTVLVSGESGTGKEFVVRLIHDESARAAGPLVSVNCAALTETLLESELFGHVRGAFTGAVRDKAGLFELASHGTLFLDEIGEMAPGLQAKLLRVLQAREIRRVGGDRTIRVNPRIVAATNRDLREATTAGRFREDLYFRLSAFVIAVPPLRDRRDDIPPLVHEFLRAAASRMKKPVRSVSAEAMALLLRYDWPGNVRELEHAVEHAVIVSRRAAISLRDLPVGVREAPESGPAAGGDLDLGAAQRVLIAEALRRFHGHRRRAAEALGISTVTLWRRMREHGLDHTRPDRD